ncbi:protein NETWORKED 1D-like [Salvia splendens]|nr:protein NETWORKED 1D-like [Salvia splendens]
MAKLSHSDSRRMYSWWWDSHISPKNSKWLQENLTDMDVKVKSMIKLLEAEEDSFARRAEMYYKKRPELMKMVEEFYRAYRALAERYDHATGVIRHAHRTMTEAQVPMVFADDSPASSLSGADPRTPDLIGGLTDDSDNGTRKRTSKPFIGSFRPIERVRRGLNFDEAGDKVEGVFSNENNHVDDKSSLNLEQQSDSKEIIALKEAIAKLEAEKEASIVQHQQTLDKLSQLETEISRTREDFSMLNDHANKADTEVAVLNRALATLEAEKESKFQDYQNCLDRISELQTTVSTTQDDAQKLGERAKSAEVEAQSLKSDLDILAVEKDAALNQYMESLKIISNTENKLRLAEENSSGFKVRAEKAESEVESLRQAISKLTEEKESTALQYQQCLETISSLEQKLTLANEEAKRLNGEIENGVSKLKGAEEQCLILEKSNQSLQSELESLMLKMGTQSQELTEKQKELGRLWAAVQEERLRFVDAETAFQTLQHLHAQTQEELRTMASELQNRAQLLKVAETQNHTLQDEVLKVKQENKHLDELNSSSALSIQDMRNEISSLTESTEKLEEEVELRLDQRNALQREIYCLKEELNDLNMKHLSILNQVHEVGLNPESLGSSVKELQDENSNLKETCQRECTDKADLLLKLEIMEQLLEKNSLLETSLSGLNAELNAVRGKIEELEQSCQSLTQERSGLLDEKETLTTQLLETNKNLEKLTENNTVLELSLSDAHHQLEALKAKSKILEDSCQLLVNEKADLMSENDSLTSQLEQTQRRLVDLEKLHGELEGRCENLENEKESTLRKVEELQVSLEAEKQEHSSSIEMNKARLTGFQSDMHVLQEEHRRSKRELDHVHDSAIASEIEIFVLRTTAQVMKENYCSLVTKNRRLIEQSSLSEKEISRLEHDNLWHQSEIRLMSDHVSTLRSGTRQLLKVLSIAEDCVSADNVELDQVYISQLSSTLRHLKKSFCDADEENLEWSVAFSVLVTWIKELGLHSKNVEVEKGKLEHEFKLKTEQVLQLQSDSSTLLEINEELKSKLREEDRHKEALMVQIENLNSKLTDMQVTCQDLQSEKLQSSEEKRSLMDSIMHSEEKHNLLEEEYYVLCDKVLALENLSFIFQSFAEEKLRVLRDLGDDHNKLNVVNTALIGKLSVAEGRLEESKLENLHLKERLQKTDNELKAVATDKEQLSVEIENGKKILHQMAQELQEAEEKIILAEKKKLELSKSVEDLRMEYNQIKMARDEQESQILKLSTDSDNLSKENNFLKDSIMHYEEKHNVLEEENYVLCDKVFALENLSLIFQSFAEEKLRVLRDLGDDHNKLNVMNTALIGKLSVTEGMLGESKLENLHLKERLQKTDNELKAVATDKDHLSVEIEIGKEVLHQMTQELQEAGEKIILAEKKKLELIKSVEDLRMEYNEIKMAREQQESQILQLSIDSENLSKKNNFLMDSIMQYEEKHNVLEEENYVLCDKVLALENLSLIFQCFADEKLRVLRDVGDDHSKLNVMNTALIGNLSVAEGKFEESKLKNLHLTERLQKTDSELKAVATDKDLLSLEIEIGKEVLHQMAQELQEAGEKIILAEKKKKELSKCVENLRMENNEVKIARDKQENQILKLSTDGDNLRKENNFLMDSIMHYEEKHNVLEEENYVLCDKVLALENLSLIFQSFADEKLRVLRDLGDDHNKLNVMNTALIGKLSAAEGRLEESKLENLQLKERLQKTDNELKAVVTDKDQLSVEIEIGKEILHQMAQEFQEAGERIILAEKKTLELSNSSEDLRMEYNEVKIARDEQENLILKLSTDSGNLSKENNFLRDATQKLESSLQVLQDNHDKSKLQEENLHLQLDKKINEINELGAQTVSLFGQLQHSMISQVLYEQKFYELYDACLGYIDQNEVLKNQLDAFRPEIVSFKECISSLEDQTDIHIKFQNPEDGDLQDGQGTGISPESIRSEDKKVLSPVSDLHDLRVRLEAVVKAAVEIKDLMVQENIVLHSKLDQSLRQIELLQSESGKHHRNRRPTSEITVEDSALLTKDIVLDQVSDGSYHYSKKEAADVDSQIVELWETAEPDGTVGLTIGKSNRTIPPSTTATSDIRRSKSTRKQKGSFAASSDAIDEDLSVDKLEISKRSTNSFQEGNKRKVLERLDSDVQKLANLQITVHDLKRKLEVTEKGKRGKAVIECETLKRQLDEADRSVMQLFDLNGRLMKSIDDRSFSDSKSSFDFEGEDGARRRRVSEQARRMSEKIGRIQLEVQKLQFILLKLDEKDGVSKMSDRRILLRDYLYGGGRGGQRRKKGHFCACVKPSTLED